VVDDVLVVVVSIIWVAVVVYAGVVGTSVV